MKIGIDARLMNETGVGRYVRNLIAELALIDDHNTYVVFIKKDSTFDPPNSRWIKRSADVPWHSVAEQFVMPFLLYRERLDLLHVPYFNVPIFYFRKFIVTIHDLTILKFSTGKASTRPYPVYKALWFGYYISLLKSIHWSKKIIAVSQTTKNEICANFDVLPEKIEVVYEG